MPFINCTVWGNEASDSKRRLAVLAGMAGDFVRFEQSGFGLVGAGVVPALAFAHPHPDPADFGDTLVVGA